MFLRNSKRLVKSSIHVKIRKDKGEEKKKKKKHYSISMLIIKTRPFVAVCTFIIIIYVIMNIGHAVLDWFRMQ